MKGMRLWLGARSRTFATITTSSGPSGPFESRSGSVIPTPGAMPSCITSKSSPWKSRLARDLRSRPGPPSVGPGIPRALALGQPPLPAEATCFQPEQLSDRRARYTRPDERAASHLRNVGPAGGGAVADRAGRGGERHARGTGRASRRAAPLGEGSGGAASPFGTAGPVSVADDLRLRRSARGNLDRRLAAIGYAAPRTGFHSDACLVGIVPKARCTCRAVVACEARRRRPSRGELLTR
jgi:hypothetical protein